MESNGILIVRKYKGFGGIEHQILNFSKALIENGWRVFILTDKPSPFENELDKVGTEVIISSFDSVLKTAKKIVHICKENKIRIIQAHMLKEDFICRLAKLINPELRHVFRVHTYIDCSWISKRKKNIYHFASFLTNPLVDIYLPINWVNANEIHRRTHVRNKKIRVIHDSVRTLERTIDDFSYPQNRIVGMVANFEAFKGHDVLLDGIRILKEKGENVTVHLIGGVPGRGTDHEDSSQLNIVKKTIKEYSLEEEIVIDGYCENIASALKECGMVVLPSDSEGTPNCLLEAMLLRKIVVASEVGGVPEFVIDNKTGFLHKPQDGKALADTMLKVFSKTEHFLNTVLDNAEVFVKKNYSMENLIGEVTSVYRSL